MSAPLTLVSFIGAGTRPKSPESSGDPIARAKSPERSGYASATYRFPPAIEGHTPIRRKSTFFGHALLRYLRDDCGLDVARWLVLGTSASLWAELHYTLPDQKREDDQNLERWVALDEVVRNKKVTAEDVHDWQQHLNAQAERPIYTLQFVDMALTHDAQMRLCRALFEHILPETDVVFDISHGFRHQPVIASFVISLMRRTHRIRNVRFWSGVWEARDKGTNIAPAIQLPVCQEILETAEAAAVLQNTGNYVPLAKQMNLDLSDAWFHEEINQLAKARSPVQKAAARLRDNPPESPVYTAVLPLLEPHLAWPQGRSYADRHIERAQIAIASGDFLHAVLLAFEAIVGRAKEILKPRTFKEHQEFVDTLRSRLSGDQNRIYKPLRLVRNACAHAVHPAKEDASTMISSPEELRRLLKDAMRLYDELPQTLRSHK